MEQEHDYAYALMMDALDGELTEDSKLDLELHLQLCSDCLREWHALIAIETLLRTTPALAPAAGFTERTLLRLPNRRYRIWALTAVYITLLLCGFVPMVLGAWAMTRLIPVLNQPALVNGVAQSIAKFTEVMGTIFTALFTGLGEAVAQQPAALGWLLVIIGVISVWSGLLRELTSQPQRA